MRRSILLALGLVAALVAPTAASATDFDVVDHIYYSSDVSREAHSSPFQSLHLHSARLAVPWDIALRGRGDKQRKRFAGWLDGVSRSPGTEPYVTFVIDKVGDRQPARGARRRGSGHCFSTKHGTDCYVPTLTAYRRAVRAFVRDYPQVKTIGAWNEPNYAGRDLPKGRKPDSDYQYYTLNGRNRFDVAVCPRSPTVQTCGPDLAARYWLTLEREFAVRPTCHVHPYCVAVAGEFSGGVTSRGLPSSGYFGSYEFWLRHIKAPRPYVWAIHPYPDARNNVPSGQTQAARVLEGSTGRRHYLGPHSGFYKSTEPQFQGRTTHLWASAVGVFWSTKACGAPNSVDCQTYLLARYFLRMATLNSAKQGARYTKGRLPRVYVYQWQNPHAGAKKDGGLLYPPDDPHHPNQPRPSYALLAKVNGRS